MVQTPAANPLLIIWHVPDPQTDLDRIFTHCTTMTTAAIAKADAKGNGNSITIDKANVVKREKRRLYNRLCAARSRKRIKESLSTLQAQVDSLTRDKAVMAEKMELMRLHIMMLEKRNQNLTLLNDLSKSTSPSLSSMNLPNAIRQTSLQHAAFNNTTRRDISTLLLQEALRDLPRGFPSL
jgi:hypothetical protein